MPTIERYEHGEGDFWQRMGEFFASPEVRRALGRPMSSTHGYVWWVAIEGDQVAGFAALAPIRRNVSELRHAYVLPAYRRRGIYRALLQARITYAIERGVYLITVATVASQPELEAQGFVVAGHRGRYARMELAGGD